MKGILIILILITVFFSLPVFGQESKKIKITGLEKIIAESKTPFIINFWATFCKPCMEEIPYLLKLEKKYEKMEVKLLLVSLDMKDAYPRQVNTFINKTKITAPVVWLDETDADYFCPKIDNTWSGAIPATLFINNKNRYRKFIEDPLTEEQLENEISKTIGK
ncbi:MAG: TlpA disulfide reductase family protein [Chitinophagaceae bacterium]